MTAKHLQQIGAEVIVLNGTFSYIYQHQEKQAKEWIHQDLGSNIIVCCSSDVGGIGAIERENTAILNAALKKSFGLWFNAIESALNYLNCPLYVIQNNGTVISFADAIENPIKTISSGLTNSFIDESKLVNLDHAIIADIGNTSTDVGIIIDGFPRRMVKNFTIGGIVLQLAAPNTHAIALGGRSIVESHNETFKIGPTSVGYNLFKEAKAFGGNKNTLADVVVSLDIVQEWQDKIKSHTPQPAKIIMSQIINKISDLYQKFNPNNKEIPMIIVCGGANLLAKEMLPQYCIIPKDCGVANTYGAALAEMSATIDTSMEIDKSGKAIADLTEQVK